MEWKISNNFRHANNFIQILSIKKEAVGGREGLDDGNSRKINQRKKGYGVGIVQASKKASQKSV